MASQTEAGLPSTTPTVDAAVTLRVADLNRARAFYCGTLGMKAGPEVEVAESHRRACLIYWEHDEGICVGAVELLEVAAGVQEAGAQKRCEEGERVSGDARGWCNPDTRRDAWVWLGLGCIPDVDAAVAGLQDAGVNARLQGQFLDIGYVAHFVDPDGYKLEVLQQTMQRNFRRQDLPPAPPTPLRAPAPAITQFKFNISNVEASLAFFRDGLGMRLLSQQEAAPYKFTVRRKFSYTSGRPSHGFWPTCAHAGALVSSVVLSRV